MPEKTDIEAEASAEKAYAAAAEAVAPKPASETQPVVSVPPTAVAQPAPVAPPAAKVETKPEVEFPSKAKRGAKPEAAKQAPVPVTAAPGLKAVPVKAAVKTAPKKALAPQQPVKPLAVAKPKTVAAPKIINAKAAAPKTVAQKTLFQQLKDKTVSTTDFTTKIKTAVTDAQVKAKEAFDKGAATFADYNEFSKGNVEAVVASGKILAAGAQSLGKTFVEDGKTAFEILTAEVKELSTVKSPVDFFKLQVEFLRRNFDIAVSNTSKNSEAVLKLANEAAAPISARVNLAVEKVKQAA